MAYAPFWLKVLYHYLGLTHQASVRRGPRASATSLFTVSLAESEASAFLANRVCASPICKVFPIFQSRRDGICVENSFSYPPNPVGVTSVVFCQSS